MSVTKVICFANNKGGSGKSTTCANVGYSMSTLGKKVLLIDGDMQMNLTLSFFDDEKSLELAKNGKNIYTATLEQRDLTDYVIPTDYEGLDIIPSSTLMSSIELQLFTKFQRELILRHGLEKIKASGKYDYILIDSPPTLGCWGMNIAITKASERKNYFKQTVETLSSLDNVRLLESIIRIDSTVEWSQDNSKPVMAYKKNSRAAGEYMKLAQEVMSYADR